MTAGARRAAALKLTGLALLGVAVFRVGTVAVLALLLAAVTMLAVLGGVRLAALARAVRPAVPVVAAVVLAHGVLSGWHHAALVGGRILVLVAAAAAMSLSTPVPALLAVVSAACRPLRPLGVDPHRVGLVLAMAIRFVPLLGERLRGILQAQRARGVERPGAALLPPLVITTLRLADDLADALDARGLGDGPAGD